MDRLHRIAWLLAPPPLVRGIKRGRLVSVRMEVGRGEAAIVAAAHADRRVQLAFGTGEEFDGSYLDLPAKVGVAARNVLDVAAPFIGRLPLQAPDDPTSRGSVRFEVRTATAVYADGSGLAELRNGSSRLAPMWYGFSELLAPLIVALFKRPRPGSRARRELPALVRARGLWG